MIMRIGAVRLGIAIIILMPWATSFAQGPETPASDQRQRVEKAVAQVLDSREFSQLSDSSSNWFQDWIKSTVRSISEFFAGMPTWVVWLILIWMVLTLIAILAHLIWTLWITLGGRGAKASRAQGGEVPEEWLGIRDLQFDSVLARARALRAQGRWAEAVRHAYVASLLWLQDRKCIAYHRSKTNRDFVRETAKRPRVAQLLAGMTGAFETIAYRGRDATDADVDLIERSLEKMQHEVPSA